MVDGIGSGSYGAYGQYGSQFNNTSMNQAASAPAKATDSANEIAKTGGGAVVNAGPAGSTELSEAEVRALKRAGAVECATCASRQYQDGSDENVSFKSPAHISPASSGAKVAAHEQEHVSNAYSKAAEGNGRVVSTAVSLHTSTCPECGRSYVSGGTTNSTIKYNEQNPYGQNKKSQDYAALKGSRIDTGV